MMVPGLNRDRGMTRVNIVQADRTSIFFLTRRGLKNRMKRLIGYRVLWPIGAIVGVVVILLLAKFMILEPAQDRDEKVVLPPTPDWLQPFVADEPRATPTPPTTSAPPAQPTWFRPPQAHTVKNGFAGPGVSVEEVYVKPKDVESDGSYLRMFEDEVGFVYREHMPSYAQGYWDLCKAEFESYLTGKEVPPRKYWDEAEFKRQRELQRMTGYGPPIDCGEVYHFYWSKALAEYNVPPETNGTQSRLQQPLRLPDTPPPVVQRVGSKGAIPMSPYHLAERLYQTESFHQKLTELNNRIKAGELGDVITASGAAILDEMVVRMTSFRDAFMDPTEVHVEGQSPEPSRDTIVDTYRQIAAGFEAHQQGTTTPAYGKNGAYASKRYEFATASLKHYATYRSYVDASDVFWRQFNTHLYHENPGLRPVVQAMNQVMNQNQDHFKAFLLKEGLQFLTYDTLD